MIIIKKAFYKLTNFIKKNILSLVVLLLILYLVIPTPLSVNNIEVIKVIDKTYDNGYVYFVVDTNSYHYGLLNTITYDEENCYISFKGSFLPLYNLNGERTPVYISINIKENYLKNIYIIQGNEKKLIFQK